MQSAPFWRPAVAAPGLVAMALLLAVSAVQAEETFAFESAGQHGIALRSQGATGVEVRFVLASMSLEPVDVAGEVLRKVTIPGVFLPNDAGAPDLPGMGRFIAIPRGATATVEIVSARTQVMSDIRVAPAPVIPREDDPGPLVYDANPGSRTFRPTGPAHRSSCTESPSPGWSPTDD